MWCRKQDQYTICRQPKGRLTNSRRLKDRIEKKGNTGCLSTPVLNIYNLLHIFFTYYLSNIVLHIAALLHFFFYLLPFKYSLAYAALHVV